MSPEPECSKALRLLIRHCPKQTSVASLLKVHRSTTPQAASGILELPKPQHALSWETLALHYPSEVLLSHRGVMIETRRMHEAGTEAAKNPLMRVLDVCVSTCMVRHALNVYSGRECDDMLG